MDHYFNRMQPVILNEHNVDILNHLLNQFIDEVKGEIQAWSERGSGMDYGQNFGGLHKRSAIPTNARRKLYAAA